MKPSLTVSSLAAALFLAPALASAQPQGVPPNRPNQGQPGGQMRPGGDGQAPMGRMQMRQPMKVDLGLTDIQKADMRKVRETAQRDRLRKSTDFKIASMDLKSLLRAEKVDEKAVAAKLTEVQAAQGALLKVRVDSALAMKRILTPEQQKKMSDMRDQRTGQRNMRRNMGRGVRGGGLMGNGMMGNGMMRGRQGRQGQPMAHPMDLDQDIDPEGPISR